MKLILEGMEETNSNLEAFVEAHPDLFQCDLFIVADAGNIEVGKPALTTTLRGEVSCIVTVRTLKHALHSGVFGGAAPDAMMAMAWLLASLLDESGDVAVKGVTRFDWSGSDLTEEDFRSSADMIDGTGTVGSGTIGSRLWSRPSISAIGLDTNSIAGSSNVLIPEARAKVSMRIAPGSEPKAELDALVEHLESHAPWDAGVEVERTSAAPPFRAATGGPGYIAARAALEAAYGKPVVEAGSGGSIPLLHTLSRVAPGPEFVLLGAGDMAKSRVHSSDESVDPSEIERMIVAQALMLESLSG